MTRRVVYNLTCTQGGNSRRRTRRGKAFPDVRHTRNRSERQILRRRQRIWGVHGCSQSTNVRTLNRPNITRLQFDSGALAKERFTANSNNLVRRPTPAKRSDPVMQAQLGLGEITVPAKKERFSPSRQRFKGRGRGKRRTLPYGARSARVPR